MIALVQRVDEASVSSGVELLGAIGPGILALIGVERGDGEAEARRLAEKVVSYRLFSDAAGKMNLSLKDTGGALLAVPQFTLAADTDSGLRPSFSSAAPPQEGERLFALFRKEAGGLIEKTASGRFGADMKVRLVNDGPVTFWLRVAPSRPS
ncbi:MAG TPA: D-aminoacyl-tRNA deacylase [Burkholderiales bacterium]|nr:D-aminoacyl-tRNA deacylase [Burkholderiales bacterium]